MCLASEAAELCRPLHVQVFCRASSVLLLKPCCLAKTFPSVCRGDCKAVRHECFRKTLQHGLRPSLLQCRSSSDTPLLAAAAPQHVRGQLPSCCRRLEPNERVPGAPENRLGRRQLSRVSSTCLAPGSWRTSKKEWMRQSFLMTLRRRSGKSCVVELFCLRGNRKGGCFQKIEGMENKVPRFIGDVMSSPTFFFLNIKTIQNHTKSIQNPSKTWFHLR